MQHSPTPSFKPQALVLCAGRGERMRPLSDHTPKPLLEVHGKPLVSWHLEHLANAGIAQVLINTAWLGDHIPDYFLAHPPVSMQLGYSREDLDFAGALETAGGVVRALPTLADPFWVVAGDVFIPGFDFSPAVFESFVHSPHLAHVWLVPNPQHHPHGDFGLSPEGLALCLDAPHPTAPSSAQHEQTFTFSTVALYKKAFFGAPWCDIPAGNPQGVKAPLAPMLKAAMKEGLVAASLYQGFWCDVGTPARWAQLSDRTLGSN